VETLAQIAGLAATAWVVWETALAGWPDLMSKIGRGIAVSVEAWVWAAVMMLLLRLIVQHLTDLDVAAATWRASAAGVWFAPATLLVIDGSPLSVTAAMVLTIGATHLLAVAAPSQAPRFDSFHVLQVGALPIDLLAHHFAAALLAAVCMQGALGLRLMGHRASAAGAMLLSVALIATVARGLGTWAGRNAPNLPRVVFGLCLTVLLALMGERIVRHFGAGSGGGTGSGTSASGSPAPAPAATQPFPNLHLPGTFPGVILWPVVRTVPLLVAPLPSGRGPSGKPTHPLVIPFGGEYWMYRAPFHSPPPSSYFQRGSPAFLSFSTPDFAPLTMEAHQKLERPINLHCCRAIRLEIVNDDLRAADISIELRVARAAGRPGSESLGTVGLKSLPEMQDGREVPATETLNFSIPPGLPFDEFDEFEAIFHHELARSHSARVAIERFVLAP